MKYYIDNEHFEMPPASPKRASAPRGRSLCAGVDTDTVELTVRTLSSHLITRKFISPANCFTDAICPC